MNELDRCMPRVTRYARYLCGSRPDDADDLVQVAISEWLVKPVSGLPTYIQLRQIIRSRFLDLVKAREGRNVSLGGHECSARFGNDLDNEMAIRAVLERLPLEERYVLWSVYGQGYSVDEIALEMQVNPRTVKRRLARARMRFAAIYGEAE